MENTPQDLERLRMEFQQCRELFTALGDAARQDLLCVLLTCGCWGLRSVELAARTHLSRPAVSHHLQVLKKAGVVKARKEGTRVFYYLDPQDSEIENMARLFADIQRIMRNAPDRSGED